MANGLALLREHRLFGKGAAAALIYTIQIKTLVMKVHEGSSCHTRAPGTDIELPSIHYPYYSIRAFP